MSADPWIHRGANMVCGTCMYFVPKGSASTAGPASDMASIGRCRRHAPTINGFPAVFSSDWCGDHRLRDHRIEEEAKQKGPTLAYPPLETQMAGMLNERRRGFERRKQQAVGYIMDPSMFPNRRNIAMIGGHPCYVERRKGVMPRGA